MNALDFERLLRRELHARRLADLRRLLPRLRDEWQRIAANTGVTVAALARFVRGEDEPQPAMVSKVHDYVLPLVARRERIRGPR
jgi:hypothetical protein